jgi:hypothetical protein
MIAKRILLILFSLLYFNKGIAQQGYNAVNIDTVNMSGFIITPVGNSFILFIPDSYLVSKNLADYIDWYQRTELSKCIDSNIYAFILDKCHANDFGLKRILRTSNDSVMFRDNNKANDLFKKMIDNINARKEAPKTYFGGRYVYKDKKHKDTYYKVFRLDNAVWYRFTFYSKLFDIELPYNKIMPNLKSEFTNLYLLDINKDTYFSPITDLKIKRFKLINIK